MHRLQSRTLAVVAVIAATLTFSGCVGQGPAGPGSPTPSATTGAAVDLRAFAPSGTEGQGVSIRLRFPDGLHAGSVGTMDYLQNFVSPPVQCAPFEIELQEAGVSTLQVAGALAVVVRGEGGKTVAPAFVIPGEPVRAAFASSEHLTKGPVEDSDLTELEGFTLAALYPTSAADWERFSGRVLDLTEVELDQPC